MDALVAEDPFQQRLRPRLDAEPGEWRELLRGWRASHERAPLLSAAIQAGTDAVQRHRILLIDDLWETGSTLRRVAEVLGQMGATEVRALAMTRTK